MESDVIQMATVPVQIGELVGSTFVTEKLLAAGETSTILIARSKGNPDLNLVALKVQPIYIVPQALNSDIAVLKSTQENEHFSKIQDLKLEILMRQQQLSTLLCSVLYIHFLQILVLGSKENV
ncbi:MAG: hypothetical protein EZS28_032528 [Streblomastix strix]|uniref:Uncharacterized protein n=1 Tax=Streblomastix strix TaxID=222440 RepID=A0A5J4UQ81_9EUKA|nr:MAG: hypothetical protein EZS28_032528 [Streblomastix strix]